MEQHSATGRVSHKELEGSAKACRGPEYIATEKETVITNVEVTRFTRDDRCVQLSDEMCLLWGNEMMLHK